MNTEYRLGNIVTQNGIETRVGLLAVGADYNYEPIPLTEEWLLKFGFEKGNYNWFRMYFGNRSLVYNINSKMLCIECFYYGEQKSSIQILGLEEKYIHQLQNLYFALTQTELTIKQL